MPSPARAHPLSARGTAKLTVDVRQLLVDAAEGLAEHLELAGDAAPQRAAQDVHARWIRHHEFARNYGSADRTRSVVPTAATILPREIYRAPKAWAEALWPNLMYWNEIDKGGHFAAFEQPALFTSEL